jgi:hypothetical protein
LTFSLTGSLSHDTWFLTKPRFCFPGNFRHSVLRTLSFLWMHLTLYRFLLVQYILLYLQEPPW